MMVTLSLQGAGLAEGFGTNECVHQCTRVAAAYDRRPSVVPRWRAAAARCAQAAPTWAVRGLAQGTPLRACDGGYRQARRKGGRLGPDLGVTEGVNTAAGTGHPIASVIGGKGDADNVGDFDAFARQRAVELGPRAEIESAPVGADEYVTPSRGRRQDGPDVMHALADPGQTRSLHVTHRLQRLARLFLLCPP